MNVVNSCCNLTRISGPRPHQPQLLLPAGRLLLGQHHGHMCRAHTIIQIQKTTTISSVIISHISQHLLPHATNSIHGICTHYIHKTAPHKPSRNHAQAQAVSRHRTSRSPVCLCTARQLLSSCEHEYPCTLRPRSSRRKEQSLLPDFLFLPDITVLLLPLLL